MARAIKFHFDENCHRAIAEGFRRLVLIWELYEPDYMANRVEFI
jgi:hypothetical protein